MKIVKKGLVAAFAAAILVCGSATAASAAPAEAGDTVVIDGRTFGAAEGLERGSGSFAANGSSGGFVVFAADVTSWGSSYVSNDHPSILHFVGKAYAAGNVHGGKRFIQTSFKYTRGGADIISWQRSNAKINGCSWSAGSVVQKSVGDSLGWNDPKTHFRWDYATVAPQAC